MMFLTLQASHTRQWRYTKQPDVLRKCEIKPKIVRWSLRDATRSPLV
jgi:hypothetical protein